MTARDHSVGNVIPLHGHLHPSMRGRIREMRKRLELPPLYDQELDPDAPTSDVHLPRTEAQLIATVLANLRPPGRTAKERHQQEQVDIALGWLTGQEGSA